MKRRIPMKPKIFLATIMLVLPCFAWDRQHQNQHQTQSQTSNNTAVGGTSNVGFTSNEVRQTPPAFAPDAFPSAPCRVAASAGGSSQWFGIAIGGSKLDKDCAKRELARLLLAAGQRQAAVQALCSTDAAKGIKDCNSLEMESTVNGDGAAVWNDHARQDLESPEPPNIVFVTLPPVIEVPIATPVLTHLQPTHRHRASKPCKEKTQ